MDVGSNLIGNHFGCKYLENEQIILIKTNVKTCTTFSIARIKWDKYWKIQIIVNLI